MGDAVRMEVFLTNKEDDFAAMKEVYGLSSPSLTRHG